MGINKSLFICHWGKFDNKTILMESGKNVCGIFVDDRTETLCEQFQANHNFLIIKNVTVATPRF